MREIYDTQLEFLTPREYRMHQFNFANREAHFDEPLPYLDTELNFAYSFEIAYPIYRIRHYIPLLPIASTVPLGQSLFNGKIWLLIGEGTASAAEATAAIIKQNNIATVVGEPTWGIMGTIHEPVVKWARLPNTGIMFRFDIAYYTDPYGRPWQGYGVQPNYFNRPGMDALQTVLAMIEESNY